MHRMLLCTVALAAFAGPALADPVCPVTTHDDKFLANVVTAMKSKSCGEAADIARACALGASGDSVIAGEATKVCQADFAKSKADKSLFTTLSKRCAKKYAKSEGTMYVSMAAFCQLDVSLLLSDLNRPVE